MSILLAVTFGEKLPDTDGKPWTYTMQQRLDCLNDLLDRAIGKPKQTIEETGDDASKEVLRTMQALLKVKKPDDTTNTPIAPEQENISSIEAMKRKDGALIQNPMIRKP